MTSNFLKRSPCERTDLLELAVMHRQTLHLQLIDGTEQCLRPHDLLTEQGRDWLVGHTIEGQLVRFDVANIREVLEFQSHRHD